MHSSIIMVFYWFLQVQISSFRIGIEIVDVREVCLIQVEIDLNVVYLLRLSLEVGYGGSISLILASISFISLALTLF